MNTRRIVLLGSLAVVVSVSVVAAMAMPVVGLRSPSGVKSVRPSVPATKAPSKLSDSLQRIKRRDGSIFPKEPIVVDGDSAALSGPLDPRAMSTLGFSETPKKRKTGRWPGAQKHGDVFKIQSGQPKVLNARSALSAALFTNIGGRDTQFSEVTLLADWDGREDCTADREVKVDDFSFVESDIDFVLTRTAISEHTIANGFNENIFYYGDSVGNVWIGADTNGDGSAELVKQINLPTMLGSATFPLDDQVTVTGLAVNPAADFSATLTSGEVLWGSFTDSEGFTTGGGGGTPNRSGLFFILLEDVPDMGFPVTITGPAMLGTSTLSSPGGVAVDDNGDVYWHLADLVQLTGGRIVKTFDIDGDRFPDIGFVNYTSVQTGPAVLTPTFGNIVSITSGPCNTIYAAVARSFVPTDDPFTQLTEGLFTNPTALGPTPSMIISFADCAGQFDACSGIATGSITTNVGGTLPIGDGFADVAMAGQTLVPGVNNFRVFALGIGPDIRPGAGTSSIVSNSTLKLEMQIDFSAHAGITVDENGTVFVISGGQPAGVGKNPSPMLGEILCFEDSCPADRRADFVDLRGDVVPNPPANGGNVGDGDSDRFDHIWHQAPVDQITFTPTGFAGLSHGFLRYTNRLAPNPISPGVTLGFTKPIQGDDDTDGVIFFEHLDPGHQVAGGDDQNTPFRGDDDNGAGSPNPIPPVPNSSAVGTALNGGFEFLFGGPVGTAGCVWNGFFLNSNGSITFGAGDTDNSPTAPEFRSGLPKIAPAWADLNPNARAANPRAFPLQAIGFSGVNSFKVRWINVPEFGFEDCGGLDNFGFPLAAHSNTFSVTLYDDGTGIDENANQALNPANRTGNNLVAFDLQEGPTDLRFTKVSLSNPVGGSQFVGCSPRPEGSGIFVFDYCRMDLLGTAASPVITGYSIGGLDPLNPPGLCETNLSVTAAQADAGTFGVLSGGQIAAIGCNCCIGEGTEPTIFELFNEGARAGTGAGGEITFARPDFDLRFEGNDAAICTSARQRDLNRGRVCFLGIGCAPPTNPICALVVPGTFVTTPNTTGVVNSLCAVQLNLIGCGFFPNEVTTICQGFAGDTGVPLQRAGKTVTTAATLSCDTNGDGIAETTVALTTVTPVSCNLLTAVIPISGTFGSTSSSGFPAACCGGAGTITVTTTFTAGDNNAFGPFTRTTICSLALGTRAPIVFSVTPSGGDCSLPDQDLLISGACFQINGVAAVTSVFAQDISNPANIIQAKAFQVLNANLIDAHFTFGSANAGKTFLIFVTGPGGTSRNLTTLPAGSPAGCALGNEQGIQVTFKCNAPGTPGGPGTPLDVASVTGCKLDRQANGTFFLDVTGTKIKDGAVATVGGIAPKKIKVVEVESGTTNPTKLRLIKKVCSGLPGNVVITNPGAAASQPFLCTERCPGN